MQRNDKFFIINCNRPFATNVVKKETTTLESHQVRYLSPEFGYVLVRNKFSTYMYYIVLLPVNHWKFDIPLIATEKKIF